MIIDNTDKMVKAYTANLSFEYMLKFSSPKMNVGLVISKIPQSTKNMLRILTFDICSFRNILP